MKAEPNPRHTPHAAPAHLSDGGQENAGSNGATIIQACLQRVALLSALDPTPAAGADASNPPHFKAVRRNRRKFPCKIPLISAAEYPRARRRSGMF